MISAQEARGLFIRPPYELTEIEEAIKTMARDKDYTCFDGYRWNDELTQQLAELGYTVRINSINDVIVSWKGAE